ncbi:MAG TPA: WYL domain-containing protein, partial [Syntrophales bacterium]|nr:WYL domain-containing protein [Syntrophales bacterium]
MPSAKNPQTRLIRLGQMLKIFLEREKADSTWLSNHFHTTPRTIQRDLLLLKEAGFPLRELKKGTHALNKDILKNLEVFDDTELSLVVALKNMVSQLGAPFQKAADELFSRVCDASVNMPVFVKIDDAGAMDARLINRAVKAIRERKQVAFRYAARAPHDVSLEPYRIAYYQGFWYLVGLDCDAKIIKRYAIDRIEDFKTTKICCKGAPPTLDDAMRNSANIWFADERNLEVTVQVDGSCSDYFKRRRIYPTQEIREEKPDGSLIVSFQVGHYD